MATSRLERSSGWGENGVGRVMMTRGKLQEGNNRSTGCAGGWAGTKLNKEGLQGEGENNIKTAFRNV